MKRTTTFFSVTFAVILFAVLSLDATYDRHNGEHLLKAPSVSTLNTQEYAQRFLQNSEKDIVFIENLGQITDTRGEKRPDILFLTRSEGVDMYMTNSGISYVFRHAESGYRMDMEFVGMNKDITIKKELAVDQQFHYYTPEFPDGISPRAYKKLTIENIYEGIDLVYYEQEGRMKYDFLVKAGADPGKIKMKYKGASSIDIDNIGNVIITTPMGEIREQKPYTFSKNTGSEIESRYRVKNNTVLFDIAEYDKSEVIIIDPIRLWATFYGGSAGDSGNDICTDNSGNLYVTGSTGSSDFPTQTLTGAYNQTTFGGGGYNDAYILKFNGSGERIWATYYGGSGGDGAWGICTDNSGNLYVTGRTKSSDFPTQTLTGAYNQTTFGGGGDKNDVFILKFNSSSERIWATYYGGNSAEKGYSICTDNSGNLYVTGRTGGNNFPIQTLTGAYNQTTSGGGNNDAFILKFNSSCERVWATYYGGIGGDTGRGICADNSGNFYVTGETWSANFPIQTLSGAYNQTTFGGICDAYILKFNSSCERIWATFYGGSTNDIGKRICTDDSGNLYVTGGTTSSNFPTQALTGAYNQTNHGGGTWDDFLLKFNSSCERIWATFYGGSGWDDVHTMCTDNSGHFYVTGFTESIDFPTQTLIGSYNQTTFGGWQDAIILKFNSSCERIWATYYGGSDLDLGYGICTDNSGNLYVTGETESSNFPTLTLTGAYNQSTSGGGYDAFILRFVEDNNAIGDIDLQNFNVYPNPVKNVLNINLSSTHEMKDGMISLINIRGKVITSVKVTEGMRNIRINTSGVAPGLYYVQIVEHDRIIGTGKVVIGR
ncbi:SBBP repeat-containing protein [candidate division KSB1 bacterium]